MNYPTFLTGACKLIPATTRVFQQTCTFHKLGKNFTSKGPCIVKYMTIIVQQDATIHSLFISVNRSTCFGWYLHPSSAAHITVSTASGVSKTVTATCRERDWTGTELLMMGGDTTRNM